MPETRGLIGPRELAKMKPTAFLINTSRGPVVNEARSSMRLLREKSYRRRGAGRLRARAANRRWPAPAQRRARAALGLRLGRDAHENGHDRGGKRDRALRRAPPAEHSESGSSQLERGRTQGDHLHDTDHTQYAEAHARRRAKPSLAAAERRAAEIGVPMDIAVVDDGGHLLAFAAWTARNFPRWKSPSARPCRRASAPADGPRARRRPGERGSLARPGDRQPRRTDAGARRRAAHGSTVSASAPIGASNGTRRSGPRRRASRRKERSKAPETFARNGVAHSSSA